MRANLLFIITVFVFEARSQSLPLFDNAELLAMVDRGGDFIYNEQFDSADMVIDSVEMELPGHPIVDMMHAMKFAWQDQPIRISSEKYALHDKYLNKTLQSAALLRNEYNDDLEAMFFEMAVHGLKAEYYAREGSYLKAVNQAQKTYGLVKRTMDLTHRSSEFLFLAGLYNYFREKYPERHPIYKPFLWFFRSGDKARGLEQLDSAVYQSKIVKIEAGLYISYIYLRYENKPLKAMSYLKKLHDEYPNNSYFKAKYIECLVVEEKYNKALPLIQDLIDHDKPYYQLCGLTYQALYFEKVLESTVQAEKYYEKAIQRGEKCVDRGEYYRSMAYLGLGRILEAKQEYELSAKFLQLAIEEDDHPKVTAEAKERLARVNRL